MIRLRLHVGREHDDINVCEDCPAFRDPDPRPCYCALDPADMGRALPDKVHVGGPIPFNCPLLTLHVEVLERDAGDRPEGT